MASQTIAAAERQVLKAMRGALRELAGLVNVALVLAASSVTTAASQRPTGQSRSLQVTALLIVRVMNDLRAALHLAHLGYPVQAAALVAGLYEIALTVAYVGVDDTRAEGWFKHDDPATTPWRVPVMVAAVADRFDINRDKLYKQYRLLCMLKHGNPKAERQRVVFLGDGRMRFPDGPASTEEAQEIAWFALLGGVSFVLLAQRAFVADHVGGAEQDQLLKECLAIREALATKRAEAVRRWPGRDPFEGRTMKAGHRRSERSRGPA